MELTPQHLIHVRQSGGCIALVPARNGKVGDMVYAVEDGVVRVQEVLAVESGLNMGWCARPGMGAYIDRPADPHYRRSGVRIR
jgi:hypothetical protein